VTAAVLGKVLVSDSAERPKQAENGLVRFQDDGEDLAISYPATWRRIPSPDPEVRLVAGGTDESSVLMRTVPLGASVGPASIGSAKKLTDKLVMAAKRVKQLRPPRRVDDLGGLPGWLYIYTFEERATGQRGAHAHYFLFRGKTMITLVFQTLPAAQFATFAPLFDRLATTFDAKPAGRDS